MYQDNEALKPVLTTEEMAQKIQSVVFNKLSDSKAAREVAKRSTLLYHRVGPKKYRFTVQAVDNAPNSKLFFKELMRCIEAIPIDNITVASVSQVTFHDEATVKLDAFSVSFR